MKDDLILCYECGCEIEEGNEYQDETVNICEDCFMSIYVLRAL